MSRILVAGSGSPGSIGHAVMTLARARGHVVRKLTEFDKVSTVGQSLAEADAVILIPRRGDAWRHTHDVVRTFVSAAGRPAGTVHLVLLTSFAVGHGLAHPLNRTNASLLPGRLAAESALRSSGLAYTIIRPTWLTDDPPGAHAVTLTQDPYTDGMVARADLAVTMVAAVEQPSARGRTFAVFNEPGAPPTHWNDAFARLRPDSTDEKSGEPV